MSAIGKWGMVAVATGMVLTVSSCASLHRHHRHHHHPHRHRIVADAEQGITTQQNGDCLTFEACLAIVEPGNYGDVE